MSQIQYETLHPQFGASLRGIDLGKPLAADVESGRSTQRSIGIRSSAFSISG
jgi:hypothetical protein